MKNGCAVVADYEWKLSVLIGLCRYGGKARVAGRIGRGAAEEKIAATDPCLPTAVRVSSKE
ncbi:MAG: hypothetical protein Q4B16_03345 [Bacteroidia bacterium]|nr:hypothetical protein [Bacteroidia bacterium]